MFEPNEIIRAIVLFGLLGAGLFARAGKVGWDRTTGSAFIRDRRAYIAQKVTPEKGLYAYLVLNVIFYFCLGALIYGFAKFFVFTMAAFRSWLLIGALFVLVALWLITILNFITAKLFTHSELAVAMTWAIRQNRKLPNGSFYVMQTDAQTVIVRHATDVTFKQWLAEKEAMEGAGNLDISDVTELRRGEIQFTCRQSHKLVARRGAWFPKGDDTNSLVRLKYDVADDAREVYFLFDPHWCDSTRQRFGRIKIGGGRAIDRIKSGRTWVINMEVLGFFPETSDFNEKVLQRRFRNHRILECASEAGGEWFYDTEEIRAVVAARQLTLTQMS